MHENDPNRFDNLNVRDRPTDKPTVSPHVALGGLVVLALLALGFAFWYSLDTSRTTMTENAPAYRAPASPPPSK